MDSDLEIPDYHLHTPLCKHASGTPALYFEAAVRMGVPEICFTDHCPYPDGYDPAHRMTMDQFPTYRRDIEQLQGRPGPEVLFGIEADYYPGCEDFLEEWLPAQGFDLVIGSVHYIAGWGFDNPEDRHLWDSVDVYRTWEAYFELVGKLADTGLFDVVGHLDLLKKFNYRPQEDKLTSMAAKALDRVAKTGMGLEINTSGLRKPVGEIYPSLSLLALAAERGIPVCFGSDAHRPSEVGAGFDAALDLARKAGYTHYFRIRRRKRTSFPLPDA
ncbi:MAG: histidinol-phosphatase HisJ family protein [Desulfobacteraceae bacterium]